MSEPAMEGLILNPGGENMVVCKHCAPWAIKAGKWEARFMTLLSAHHLALRLIEDAGER